MSRKNKNIFSFLSVFSAVKLFFLTLLLSSCAQVVAPGGGAKDKIAPKVLKFVPDSAQLSFNSRNILIEFDEYVTLKDLNNQLLISPPLSKTPDVTVKNKTLTIEFDKNETLKPNTTYCISFGNSVQDLNENNPIENFQYIFSTGTYIDSLELKGKVQNAFNQSTEKGILAMLYSDLSDSVVYKSQPDYFAKTDKDGNFKISNIKAGKYKLVAVKDVNNNYKYDGETEWIGFVNAPIDVSEKQNILIDLFQETAKKIFLKKYIHDSHGKVSFFFNQGSDSLRVQPINNDQKGVQEYLQFSENNDTLTYWIKNFQKDSLILQVSNGNKVLDTVSLKFITMEEALKSKRNPLKLRVLSSPNGNQSFDLGGELKLSFSNKLDEKSEYSQYVYTTISGATLKGDTITKQIPLIVSNSYVSIAKLGDSLYMELYDETKSYGIGDKMIANYVPMKEWKENTNYHLFIPPGTITDYFGLTNDSINIKFKTREEKYYGSVKLKLSLPEGRDYNYILQLQDESGDMIREVHVREAFQEIDCLFLAPKKYKLKLIKDLDLNYKWTSGSYLQKIQPEKVIYNSELINIRSNWDAELEWKISE